MPAAVTPLRRLLRLAGPISVAQIAFLGMYTTDAVMAGQIGAEALAAVGIGNALTMTGFVTMIGFCMAIAPGVARRSGAGRCAEDIGRFSSASLVYGVALWSLWGLLAWLMPPWVAPMLELEPAVAEAMIGYVRAVALGMPAVGVFFALRNVIEGLGYSRPIMWLGFAALALNLPLDWLLMFGAGPIPALGAVGCGYATAIVDLMLGVGILLIIFRDPRFRLMAPRRLPLRGADFRELFRVGSPLAGAMFFEHAIFALGGLMMARFGTAAVGGHQVALNVVALAFMIPIGLGQATAVMVGHALGAADRAAVREAARLGVASAAVFALAMMVPMFTLPAAIVGLYTVDPEVIALGSSLLIIGGAFHLFDAVQCVAAGALRGLGDTRAVLLITITCYWLLGLPLFWWLAFERGLGPGGIWWGFTGSLALAAVLLVGRFVIIARRPLPDFTDHPHVA